MVNRATEGHLVQFEAGYIVAKRLAIRGAVRAGCHVAAMCRLMVPVASGLDL